MPLSFTRRRIRIRSFSASIPRSESHAYTPFARALSLTVPLTRASVAPALISSTPPFPPSKKEIDLEKYHQLALQKQKEHRKFLASLKKKPPKDLDKIAQQIHDEVFEEIDCTACANCCKTLGPDFKEADIVRIAKYFKMKLPAFEEEFLQVDEDGDKVFKAMPCPFLGGDNLCSIYDVRPKACREFPHTDRKKIHQINHLTIKNTLTCPAAYLFVEKLRDRL